MSDDLTPAQALYQRDVLASEGRMAEAGELTEKAVLANGSYVGAFNLPDTPGAAEAELARLQSDPAFIDSLFDHTSPLHRANSALREQLQAKAFGVPGEADDAPPAEGTMQPHDYRIGPEPGQTWEDFDSDLAGEMKGFAAALQLPQSVVDQIVYAHNSTAHEPARTPEQIEELTKSCAAAMEKRYGDELPRLLAGVRTMVTGLPREDQERINWLLDSNGLGSNPAFVAAVLDHVQMSGADQ